MRESCRDGERARNPSRLPFKPSKKTSARGYHTEVVRCFVKSLLKSYLEASASSFAFTAASISP